jgi:prephenate dehydrogenase
MARRIHVIGGAGGIGRWFLANVFGPPDEVLCYDANPASLSRLPAGVQPCLVTTNSEILRYAEQFHCNDWILLCVPVPVFEAVLTELVPCLKAGSLVVTMTSVQEEPLRLLRLHVPDTSTFCGCHPLFGATVAAAAGQIVALTEFDETSSEHLQFRDALADKNLITVAYRAADHDRYMAYIQALTHFCLIGFMATLGEQGIHPRDLLKLRTPNFQFLYAFASRVIKLSPTTTGAIQSTPGASGIRSAFLDTLRVLHERFAAAPDASACAQVIQDFRAPLTGAEVEEGAEVASVAVDGLQRFEELLHRHKAQRTPFVFRHRVSELVRIGRIVGIGPDEVRLEESTTIVKRSGRSFLAVGLTETAVKNYRALGLSIRLPVALSVKKRNIKFLTASELDQFYKEQILPVDTEFNFKNPYELKEDYFEQWLPLVIPGLWKCEFIDAYRKSRQIERITLRLTFSPNSERADIIERARRAVEERQLGHILSMPERYYPW